jgi:oligoendopeptidase F
MPLPESFRMSHVVESWKQKVVRPSPDYPRNFLPAVFNPSSWEDLHPLLENLLKRDLPDLPSLKAWIADMGELSDSIMEESSRLYIDMTCDTRNPDKEKAYLHFVESIEPALAPYTDAYNRKLDGHAQASELPKEEYGKWLYAVKSGIQLYLEKNIPLHTEVSKLAQGYQKITSEMTVQWRGETKTLSQLAPFLQDKDRSVREEAWRASAERRLQDRDKLDSLFDELMELRKRIAKNLGLKDFVEYSFQNNLRTDYSPKDCFDFHEAAEKVVVPLYRETMEQRKRKLGLDTLRPWDISCDPDGGSPLKPFRTASELMDGVGKIFQELDPELFSLYQRMREKEVMDLENRVGKAPGGYQSSLNESRMPFIFMNAVGMNEDVFTLLHESGHAFHYFLACNQNLPFNRSAPMEYCEVASMSMERLGAAHLDVFYNEADRRRSIRKENEGVFSLLPWVAQIDAFQHWLYTQDHNPESRRKFWISLDEKLGPGVDWSGLEDVRGIGWHRQLHIFEVPFYYIEYGIAQIGALQVWSQARKDRAQALTNYKRGLSLGGKLGLKGLFEATGLQFDLSPNMLKPLLEEVRDSWERGEA